MDKPPRKRHKPPAKTDEKECSHSASKKLKSAEMEELKSHANDSFFQSLKVYILKAGIEKARREIFTRQVKHFGGTIVNAYSDDAGISHIVVDDKMDLDRLKRLLNVNQFPNCSVMKSTWLSMCLKQKKLVHLNGFELKPEKETEDADKNADKIELKQISPSGEKKQADVDRFKDVDSNPQSSIKNTAANFTQGRIEQDIAHSDSDYEPSDDDQAKATTSSVAEGTSSPHHSKYKLNVCMKFFL